MTIHLRGAREHNLQNLDVDFNDGLTVVTGVSGSGKTSLVFDTLYHEARRRFLEVYALNSSTQRLTPAEVDSITGLGPAIAVGQNLLNRNPLSTLATACGLHPFLRLLFSHFGERTCPACGTPVKVYTDDALIEHLLGLAQSAPLELYAALLVSAQGSHHTLLGLLLEQFGADSLVVDNIPYTAQPLDSTQPHDLLLRLGDVRLHDTPQSVRALTQKARSLGVHALAARPQGADDFKLLSRAPVCTRCGTWLKELRTVDFHRPCHHCNGKGCEQCKGTGLPEQAAAVRWQNYRLNELLALTVDEAVKRFDHPDLPQAAHRLHTEITRRLEALQRVGLGYVGLDRPSPTLSRGEAQRVRLAVALISRLEDMLHVLDEPTVGQHPADVQRLLPAFRQLPGPVIFVEHEKQAAAQADWALDLGPGAGHQGGRVVFNGTPQGLWNANTPSGRAFSGRQSVLPPSRRPSPERFLTLRGCHLRTLQHIDVPIPLERLTVVTGVSGSGKSTLVEDVLAASLEGGLPVGCQAIDGAQLRPVIVDQSPIGRNPRSNPATYTKLSDLIRDLFAAVSGFSASHFSFNRPEGACPNCQGLGAVEVSMRYLPPTWTPCLECEGQRFSEFVLAQRVPFGEHSYNIAEFYQLSIGEVQALLAHETRLPPASLASAKRILSALVEIGLGYLELGQPSPTLSGGEAQRVKLAKTLGQKSLAGQLLILDEPSTGLHPLDLAGLLGVLDRLVRHKATILVVEHNTDVMQAADWIIDLGPGGGPMGGRLLYAGAPEGLLNVAESATSQALITASRDAELCVSTSVTTGRDARCCVSLNDVISIRGARVHNLQNVDVDIPKGKLTVFTGVSGSGKSSLVGDVLEAEARRRFLETLSLYERQGTHEGAEAEVDSVSGLGVALSVAPERLAYAVRATVGSATEISHHLSALLAGWGERTCLECTELMIRQPARQDNPGIWLCPKCGSRAPIAHPQHFSSATYAAACLGCNGVGTLRKPAPEKLIIHPEKPLCEGAMYSPGFYPNGYLGKPFNHGYYLTQALGERYGFDPHKTPWNAMSHEAQQAFLFGSPDELDVTAVGRSGMQRHYKQPYPGFYGFIRDWDVGGTYTVTAPCPQCQGLRLRPEYLAVRLSGLNAPELGALPLSELQTLLGSHATPAGQEASLMHSSLGTILKRLRFLNQVGLGYLHLDRIAGTLSAGEVQRIRLAGLLGSGLTHLTLLLDEPTRGLHPGEVQALLAALFELRDEGNTVIVVEHDPLLIRSADNLVDMGPGAGTQGGSVVAQGTPIEVAQSSGITGAWLRGARHFDFIIPRRLPPDKHWLTIHEARANNLQSLTVRFPLGLLVGVCGVSGSGKSTLLIDTLGRALAPKKQTTSVAYEPIEPGEHLSIDGAPRRVLLVDQSKAGVGSPASYLGIAATLQSIYAESEDAHALDLPAGALARGCAACNGSGVLHLDMSFLPDVHLTCETCQGTGYLPEAWQVRVHGIALPEVFNLTIDQVYELFTDEARLAAPLRTAQQTGLGYLVLRQPGYALSGGEAQRLKIANELMRKSPRDTLYILDEPSVGQHLEDVRRLTVVLHGLVDAGGSVFIVEHHPHLLACCDYLIELGPGGGPQGGRLVAQGTPAQLAQGDTPIAPYLREVLQ
jgi:excinuclease ABC subunit A